MSKKLKVVLGLLLLNLFIFAYLVNASVYKFSKKYVCRECNVIFIGLDAMQASHMHFLGYTRQTTPELDAVARKGVVFSNAISPSSWTVPSFMSIFTSTYPTQHKLVNRYVTFTPTQKILSNLYIQNPNIITAADVFKKLGYITGGFTGDAGVGAVLGYDKGFDIYTDEVRFGGLQNSANHALKWIDENKGKKFFMFYHGYDAHGQFDNGNNYQTPFKLTKPYKGPYKGTKEEHAALRENGLANGKLDLSSDDIAFWRSWYDGKILSADRNFGNFIKELNKRHLLDKTILIIFSDHGTEFFEHGQIDHGYSLYDELIHVPLVIVAPNLPTGKIISEQVSTLDILPSVFDLLGIHAYSKIKQQMVGVSLVPFMTNPWAKGRNVFSETDYLNFTHKRSVRSLDGWKYIITLDTMQEELYNLNTDPDELRNLINIRLGAADKLRTELKDHLIKDLRINPDKQMSTGCLPAYPDQCVEK